MKKNILVAAALAVSFTSATAGTMGVVADTSQLLLEGGFNYQHVFYKGSYTPPESRTTNFPQGFPIRPKAYYPDDFYGGYIGLSFYTHQWLLNSRYNMFGQREKTNRRYHTFIKMTPVRLAFTADKVWGDINDCSFGLGAGAVVTNLNKGEFVLGNAGESGTEGSHTLSSMRIDPVVEAFVMKRIATHFNVKFNAEYQIPASDARSNGSLVLGLGLNYAVI